MITCYGERQHSKTLLTKPMGGSFFIKNRTRSPLTGTRIQRMIVAVLALRREATLRLCAVKRRWLLAGGLHGRLSHPQRELQH